VVLRPYHPISSSHSTVTNAIAYRAIAFDFELWSRTRQEIQRVHLEHFDMLLQTSRFKAFNIKMRLSKQSIVQKFLFVLQAGWYQPEMIPAVINALRAVAQAQFTADEAIKPIVSYLAANLHEGRIRFLPLHLWHSMLMLSYSGTANGGSPRSIVSSMDFAHRTEVAEQVLKALISILSIPTCLTRFSATLPLTRICLLLLGDKPSSTVATQVLALISISLQTSSSFSRKFELVSGWSVLKLVVPGAWNVDVETEAFKILLGPPVDGQQSTVVVCTNIIPTIFAALKKTLVVLIGIQGTSEDGPYFYSE
jgi:hypothetical protein